MGGQNVSLAPAAKFENVVPISSKGIRHTQTSDNSRRIWQSVDASSPHTKIGNTSYSHMMHQNREKLTIGSKLKSGENQGNQMRMINIDETASPGKRQGLTQKSPIQIKNKSEGVAVPGDRQKP